MSAPLTFTEWASGQVPTLDVVSASVPEPVLRLHNLVAVFDDPSDARQVVRAWERVEPVDGAVGLVVMGLAPDDPTELERVSGADPEGVVGDAASKVGRGAMPGAILGAIVVASILLVLGGWSGVVIGGAIGGALFGAVAGAAMKFTQSTGWGEAYRHSFVDADASAVVFASIHSDEAERISEALNAITDLDVALYRVDSDGRATEARQ